MIIMVMTGQELQRNKTLSFFARQNPHPRLGAAELDWTT